MGKVPDFDPFDGGINAVAQFGRVSSEGCNMRDRKLTLLWIVGF
jgi:hypothetical protein